MSKKARYRLLCPIARALDRIGDRWTLLILRDLHAGPARFTDLAAGLPGLASNLLTDRLQQLQNDDLVLRRAADFGATVYELTEVGVQTGPLLFELARFGGQFPPDDPVKRPGNLRTIALSLKIACGRSAPPDLNLVAELRVDGEQLSLSVDNGQVDVRYGAAAAPDLIFETDYESLVSVSDGNLSLEKFTAEYAKVVSELPASMQTKFLEMMGGAVRELASGDS